MPGQVLDDLPADIVSDEEQVPEIVDIEENGPEVMVDPQIGDVVENPVQVQDENGEDQHQQQHNNHQNGHAFQLTPLQLYHIDRFHDVVNMVQNFNLKTARNIIIVTIVAHIHLYWSNDEIQPNVFVPSFVTAYNNLANVLGHGVGIPVGQPQNGNVGGMQHGNNQNGHAIEEPADLVQHHTNRFQEIVNTVQAFHFKTGRQIAILTVIANSYEYWSSPQMALDQFLNTFVEEFNKQLNGHGGQ